MRLETGKQSRLEGGKQKANKELSFIYLFIYLFIVLFYLAVSRGFYL
jgi:hypothetical protein